MKATFIFLIVFISVSSLLYPAEYNFKPDESKSPIDQALEKLNLTRDKCTFEYFTMASSIFNQQEDISPLYLRYIRNPFKTPYYLAHFKKNYVDYKDSLHDTIMFMTGTSGADGVSRGYKTEPLKNHEALSSEENSIEKAVKMIYEVKKSEYKENDADTLKTETGKLPESLRQPLAYFISVSAQSQYWRDKSLRKCNEDIIKKLTENPEEVFFATSKYIENIEDHLKDFDFKTLYCGTLDLSTALEKTVEAFKKFQADTNLNKPFSFSYETPLGWICIDNTGDSVWKNNKHYLLIADLAGNDSYEQGASADFEHSASVLIDLDGNDKYGSQEIDKMETGTFGFGCFGYGYLWDAAGDDEYYGSFYSQAAGYFGVGVLIDEAGNDKYISKGLSQAAGVFGLGLLEDRDGNDEYRSVTGAQGFGYSRGYGLLVDYSGNDKYICDDTKIDYPAAQSRKHNRNFSQGCGMGYRGDLGDGHSLSGGAGRLWDMQGNDEYSAGVFTQGCGFWGGCGMLADSSGDDNYKAAYYAQGAGSHMAIGIMMDEDGNDNYEVLEYLALGSGHDMTLGFFIDKKGNDTYKYPDASLGSGKDNGIGIFMDLEGHDKYAAQATGHTTLGSYNNTKTGTLREDMFNLGFFMDANGDDEYTRSGKNEDKNNSLWIEPYIAPEYDLPFQKAAGIDGNFKNLNLMMDVVTKSTEK